MHQHVVLMATVHVHGGGGGSRGTHDKQSGKADVSTLGQE